ncbi:META domain-containing protein [Sunxiuqinia dokdonensis]|uniref:DUF306 domain-containing protein n=1 Tax=Sunxiuqinia dokdonensis TaxID=1409788 RepID=A0A0L8VBX2_9BACT|nr:META domain-containing protein [Sunxiuqinia dokdonensis]KOH45954.1 hypothetical protein NC99_12310 [Sunxiuqinia dokdonensis]
MKNLNWLLMLALLMQACALKKQAVPTGQYFGELPCADCPGISYTLSLNKNFTYSETTRYQGREASDFRDSGKYELINDTIVKLTSKPEHSGLRQFVAKNNQLFILDLEGNPIESSYANWYILTKDKPSAQVESQLNTTWELQLINDLPVTVEDKLPYLEFQLNEGRVSGFGGCNRMNGPVQQSGNTLKFGMIMTTKMACPDLETESQFLKLLNNRTWSYKIEGSNLVLTDGDEQLVFTQKK